MSKDKQPTRRLHQWIEEVFGEIGEEVCKDLRSSNEEYIELQRELRQLNEDFPAIPSLVDAKKAISLTTEETEAYVRQYGLNVSINDIERTSIYFRGHADCYAWLKRIGAL